MQDDERLYFAIDRGGTFTDVFAQVRSSSSSSAPSSPPPPREYVIKLLSVDPVGKYKSAPREGIRRILERVTGKPHPPDQPVDTSKIAQIRMGTTVATNALLERKGEAFALVVSTGFRDLLHIGDQSRPRIFDLAVQMPEVLFSEVVELDERVTLVGYTAGGLETATVDGHSGVRDEGDVVQGITGERVKVLVAPNRELVYKQLKAVYDKGIRSVAVCLMHSYTFPEHEHAVAEVAKEVGFPQVTCSSDLLRMIKIVPRGTSACVDAYLTPCIKAYVDEFSAGFDAKLHERVCVQFMQSDGGLTPVAGFTGSKAILSGPAGGVVGYALTTYDEEKKTPVIGFDMGGTSTDVSRFDGHYEHVFETTTAGITIQAPQLDINTVAAGGGSRLFFRSGLFVVGPESAGAHPGPVCYRKGGVLAVTDANLILGRIVPEHFPHIFGPTEDQPLDKDVALAAFDDVLKDINSHIAASDSSKKEMSVDEAAYGFIKVANESMCRAIRGLTEAKGHDTSRHILSCFGGAGGQHACAIARALGIRKIFIHRHSSILSAYGLSLADVVNEVQEPAATVFAHTSLEHLKSRVRQLSDTCRRSLQEQGFADNVIHLEVYLNLRYNGTDCALMVRQPDPENSPYQSAWDFSAVFTDQYKREFGFTFPERDIIVDDIRIRGIGRTSVVQHSQGKPIFADESKISYPDGLDVIADKHAVGTTSTYFEGGRRDIPIFLLDDLDSLRTVVGPALILDSNTTILVEPFCTALITETRDVSIVVGSGHLPKVDTKLDPIQLSIFSHRFMSIAEQMGRTLQKTAISTNIKERLDFSCALFGPDGGLVSNAPHIPVHLGSMQEAVRFQIRHLQGNLRDGDVLVTNHPQAGGSHLPDITVITPVFSGDEIVFFVASRGHHADIGGMSPGSMPPHSKELYQEGAAIKSFKLIENGVFKTQEITDIFNSPAQYEGCSGTRNLSDNLSDLKAQVAANHKGITLVKALIEEYGLGVVHAYMHHIRENAEFAVRDMLKGMARETISPETDENGRDERGEVSTSKGIKLHAVEYMDDGSPIELAVTINSSDGSAVFDFEGTGLEVYGNINAPPSVTASAIIYCLRCMVGRDIPLNQGCLNPVTIKIPPMSFLAPSEKAAVVGGNVLTSQRLCDVILKAFGACAASQGDTNNLTFGDKDFGYYETIGGGAGAGPTWHGRSGVHTHMTNTRITDPEIFERRYPVILRRFGLRPGSGGRGCFRGGDGVVREIEFTKELQVSILSERRAFRPYGLAGGDDGAPGLNVLVRNDGRELNLQGKNSLLVRKGERLRISTPGGGGYGLRPESDEKTHADDGNGGSRYAEKITYPKGGSLPGYWLRQTSA